MKRVSLLAILIASLVSVVFAADAEQARIEETAAEAFRSGDWETAIRNYRALADGGAVDAAVYYNLGTAYANASDPGRAIWMLLRARRLAPRDPDIRHNLNLVAEAHAPSLPSQIAIIPFAPVQAIYAYFSMNEWAALAGALTILAGLFFCLAYSVSREKAARRPLWKLGAGLAMLAIAAHAFAGTKYYEEAYSSRGIIVERGTQPSTAPSPTANTYDFVLPPGTVIRVADAGVEGWVKAIYGAGNQVYIRRASMEYLHNAS